MSEDLDNSKRPGYSLYLFKIKKDAAAILIAKKNNLKKLNYV